MKRANSAHILSSRGLLSVKLSVNFTQSTYKVKQSDDNATKTEMSQAGSKKLFVQRTDAVQRNGITLYLFVF